MNPTVDSILCGIVSSVIYDIGRNIVRQFRLSNDNFKLEGIQQYVNKKIDKKYEKLFESGIMYAYLKSPLVIDIIDKYTNYIITGQINKYFFDEKVINKAKNKCLDEADIKVFLVEKVEKKYKDENVLWIPDNNLLMSFFSELFSLTINYILEQMTQADRATVYFINGRMKVLGNGIITRLDEIENILKKSIQFDVIDNNDKFLNDKMYYTKILKDNHKMAHIYLLDKFDINKFYVPPFLTQMEETVRGRKYNYNRINLERRKRNIYKGDEEELFDDWKYIFDSNNIVYITGGAGYGKSLFMKKLIGDYEELNIIDAKEYMVIYGELKNFFVKNNHSPMSVVDFLQDSMKRETLLDDSGISKELINYYLKRGRCIVLLDALDEVDKAHRQELHSHIVNYFKNLNPNNKICITSRARGFLPEKDVEVFEIEPLDRKQIQTYVENIIKLGKFDESDRDSFLKQTQILVDKGFLNSFLVLSLLINIYKAERELPENKLELYQKCFEYISNKREKEKSQDKYNWELISTLMKDNTFMELANLGLPNNSEINKERIKDRLTKIYKTKYVSENQTEMAIEQFLIFCSDRTELFVPATGEECFKFFHRSFFEYFYSQYIFTRVADVNKIYEAWRRFDVDSEIFELTLAMFKQKNEEKYQEIIEFLLNKLKLAYDDDQERVNVMNMLVLCMQVIDDELYKKNFVDFLIENASFCSKYTNEIHNQEIIVDIIKSCNCYEELVIDTYKNMAIYEIVDGFLSLYPDLEQLVSVGKDNEEHNVRIGTLKFAFSHFYIDDFYTNIYITNNNLTDAIDAIANIDLEELRNKMGITKGQINKFKSKYKQYMNIDLEKKKKICNIFNQ